MKDDKKIAQERNNIKFHDMSSVLNFGLGSQHGVADLNRVTTKIIKGREYDELLSMFKELSSFVSDEGTEQLPEREKRMDEMEEVMKKLHMEILKEKQLLQELRHMNDYYARRLDEEILYAEGWIKAGSVGGSAVDIRERIRAMEKRIQELRTTRTVADSFSAQIKLSEDNCGSMADRIWKILVDVLPLLRGRLAVQTNKQTQTEVRRLLRENESELKRLSVR